MGKKKRSEPVAETSVLPQGPVKYSKIRVGLRELDDVSVNLRTTLKENPLFKYTKEDIVKALESKRYEDLVRISDYWFGASGIYRSACEYLAYFYKYDYYLSPQISYGKDIPKEKILKNFYKALEMLENSNLKTRLGQIALEVVKNGCYYGYLIENDNYIVIQDLPTKYCRSRYYFNAHPAVEFNMKFFDEQFADSAYRDRVLRSFPKEFQKGYSLYKQGKLKPDRAGDLTGWYLLDPNYAVKFNLDNSDIPYLLSSIPSIMDLEEAKEIDKERMIQMLMKLIIQKLPTDKNGELLFDPDEAKDLHDNARAMLSKIRGANVLTTFAEVSVEDMVDTQSNSRKDELERVERGVYNEMAIPQGMFNAQGNMALNNSILQNASAMRSLPLQFQDFLNNALTILVSTPKGLILKVEMLETTHYNYLELSKLYKEQVQYGYSKMKPQIALGHSQKEILSELYFENDILSISDIMVPAASSNTMSNKDVSENKAGRKELPDEQKSEKTIQNIESGRQEEI